MKTFAKKSLSVVLAMIMALSALTMGTASAFAAGLADYSPIGEGTTTVAKTTYKFTPSVTGYYNIVLTAAKDGVTRSCNYTVTMKDANGGTESEIDYTSNGYISIASPNTGVGETGVKYTDTYTPAQDTVKLAAGNDYYIDLSSSTVGENVASAITITKSDFRYYYTSEQSYINYVSYYEWNQATQKYDIPVWATAERTTGIAVGVSAYLGTSTAVAIPASLNGYAVKAVSLGGTPTALERRITSVTIPEGVERITDSAFSGFYALTSVNFPTTLKEIGDSAFNRCYALSGRITIPAAVETVGDKAFYDTGIASVEFTSEKTEVGDKAFGYKDVLNDATADPTDTTEGKTDGFFFIAPTGSLAEIYAVNNGFASYDRANCIAGNHPYAVTTVAATLFAKGSETSVCPVCGATAKKSIAKKTFKISSLKSSKKATIVVKAPKQAGITGYKVEYSTSKKFTKKTTKTVTVKSKKALNKTIKGLKSGKKYYVRVRAYNTTGKKTVYSKYTAVKSVKVK